MIFMSTLLISCVKLLLIPAYHSTDFEVHRNWLAVTHNLPLNKWYFEDTSEWTLDYPPLFAWFEYFLSFFAKLFDPNMLVISNLNYASDATVLFQRLSVILTDLMYAYACYRCSLALPKGWRSEVVLIVLLVTNVGLLMIDHIHFQYNGVMYGILLLSVSYILERKYLKGAFWFTFLINMKHIYLYLAPAYFVYLLRNYCFEKLSKDKICLKELINSFAFINTLKLGTIVIAVFLGTYLPFIGHIGQVIARMFPFKRGLCHAYWAPNAWALYNTIDKGAFLVGSKLGFNITSSIASMTGGLVQEFSHSILPSIKPITSTILTAIMMIPFSIKLWSYGSSPFNFIRSLVLCSLTSFLFGWHVHEKAILMSIIPLSILAILEASDAKIFLLLSTVGHYSLFPLLFPKSLLIVKVIMYLIYTVYSFYILLNLYPTHICRYGLPLLNIFESFYVLGLGSLFFYENFIHQLLGLSEKLPFLPLMMTSVYCSVGVVYCWIKYYSYFLKKKPKINKKNK